MGDISLIGNSIVEQAKELFSGIELLGTDEKIAVINQVKIALHNISPLKHHPVDCVLWVKPDTVQANDYNPNVVAPPEMKLLRRSIEEDGYTQPVVTWDTGNSHREVVDGFHRNRVVKESRKVKKSTMGYLPVTTVNNDRTEKGDRIASTIRHNRARGKHTVDGMQEIVVDLSRRNWSDAKIAIELGMDADEVLRLKQISGLAEMFADKEFSEAWEIE